MNKVVLMVIIAVVLLGGVGGVLLLSGKSNTAPSTSETNTQAASPQTAAGEQKSIKDLLTLGVAQECTYSQNGNGGTTFISGGKMRGDFTSTVEGKAMNSHMIADGQTSYVWIDGQAQGFVMTMDQAPTASGTTTGGQVDVNQKMNFSCKPWVVNSSMFDVPKDIQFMDLGKLKIPGASVQAGASAEESSSADECAACNSVPESAKAQCLQALGCDASL